MQQSRICKYLGRTCTHNRTFLCIPPAIRLQIYEEAGLSEITGDNIDLNWRPEISSPSKNTIYNLLFACRTVYTELSSILYSTNSFFIRYQDLRNLRSLKNLSNNALAAVRSLLIELNITTLERLSIRSKRQLQETLSEWQRVGSYLLAHVEPSNLHLQFICDVDDVESAQRAVSPLLGINSALAQCDVRLGSHPDPVLQGLAQNVANRAMGYHSDSSRSPFRFMDLPKELRLQVLKNTDLITPLLEVEWCPARGFGLHYAKSACPGHEEWGCCSPKLHDAFQFRHCGHHPISHYDYYFCRHRHAAFSSRCHCWAPPTSLFLTCRTLRQDAIEIFFSKNRFIITPSDPCDRPATHTPDRLEASIFFTQAVPPLALRYLRFIEIVFPPFEEDYLRADEPAYPEWLQTIALMKNGLNLPILTLRVYMANIGAYDLDQGLPNFRRNIGNEQSLAIIRMYMRTLQPLAELKGLGKLFVHVVWPTARTKRMMRLCKADPGYLARYTKGLNIRIEKGIMGTAYDSSILEEPSISQWLERSTQDPFGA